MASLDQQRNHFIWLQEQYDAGLITRSALVKAAASLGLELAPERVESDVEGFMVQIP